MSQVSIFVCYMRYRIVYRSAVSSFSARYTVMSCCLLLDYLNSMFDQDGHDKGLKLMFWLPRFLTVCACRVQIAYNFCGVGCGRAEAAAAVREGASRLAAGGQWSRVIYCVGGSVGCS